MTDPAFLSLNVVPLAEFVAVDEVGAAALLGGDDGALIPENGDVMFYGDGGAGKTTLTIDGAFHLAAGDDWLGIPVARPLRVLVVENEGPRPLFRAKLRRKLESWNGSPLDDRLLVVEAPWAETTFDDELCRNLLANTIRDHEIDVAIVGPVARSGMNDAGTLQEVRDFMLLVVAVRRLAGRHVTFVLVHHESKGGKVSGAWEGAGDTLLHVQAQGHGRTRLYIQKARWSSKYHATSLNLVWTDGEGFQTVDAPELDDETLGEQIVEYIRANPGTPWGKVEEATKGINDERRRRVRDGLFAARRIVNVVADTAIYECPARKTAHLHRADDPTINHLRLSPDADQTQIASARGEEAGAHLRPASRPIETQTQTQTHSPPETTLDTHIGTDAEAHPSHDDEPPCLCAPPR